MKKNKEDISIEESWDKKKVVVGLTLFLIALGTIILLKDRVFGKTLNPTSILKSVKSVISLEKDVKGISSQDKKDSDVSIPVSSAKRIQMRVYEQVESIKKEISNLSFTEIASSSPQVQKILKDVENLEKLPRNQAKEACQKICDSF